MIARSTLFALAALAAAAALLSGGGTRAQQGADAAYLLNLRASTPGNDLACGQKDADGNPQPFCRICGGVTALADACDANPGCESFDVEGSYCGYLKKAGARVYTEGFTSLCKAGTAGCTGTYSLRRRSSVPGNDVDCNYKDWQGKLQPYCRVSGDLAGAAAACSANPGCRAFDMADESTAYLKTAAAPSEYTEGSNTFAKAA